MSITRRAAPAVLIAAATGAAIALPGAYANARGVLVSRVVANGSDDTITLIG
jgi:hypothetical protein